MLMKSLRWVCIGMVLVVFLISPTSAQVNEQWVARYNGSATGHDQARALAVDSDGNVYVTGSSSRDCATVKYDSDGNELWAARYNGPGNYFDYAVAIAVDSDGNVYVTGYGRGDATQVDYATVKYDSDGNELWVARYNGPGNFKDDARALAVDSNGNVYVTGKSDGDGTQEDYATVKYDSDGNELWVARYNSPANGWDSAYALAVDSDGNVYVTGVSSGYGTGPDYATVKYDSDGNEQWVARYNGPGNSWDLAYALAIDSDANVHVTGESQGDGTNYDYATVKYDTDGTELWVARYNGPGNGTDWAKALAIDSAGNVYVTGYSDGDGTFEDYATVKYDTDGTELWVARYNGPGNELDWAHAIAVDSDGNVYVTGVSDGDSGSRSQDYATVKYYSDGNEHWVARYNGPANFGDLARAIAIDSAGNAYVTGESQGDGTGYDYATIKYTQPQKGDLDGDGDVDRGDLNILMGHRSDDASHCPECDLDGDGTITALDARMLVLLCTRPGCVVD